VQRLGRLSFLCLIFPLFARAEAADLLNGLKINGSLDMNYVWNFNQPPPVQAPTGSNLTQPPGNNKYRSFDLYHDDFSLALAELTFEKKVGNVTAFIALDFGHTAEVLSPNDEVTKNVTQAYLTYVPKSNPRWSFVAGKMLTHIGLELIKTSANWNYSRSLLFSYAGPFWHTGVGAKYAIVPDRITGAIYIYNQTSGVYQTGRSKTLGAQLQTKPWENVTLTYNLIDGQENDAAGIGHVRQIHELVATYDISPEWSVAGDMIFGDLTHAKASGARAQWFAWTAAARYKVGWFMVSPRFEIYNDKGGVTLEPATDDTAALPQKVDSETLTFGFDCGDGLQIKLEGRRDHSTAQVFPTAGLNKVASQTTATLGILYDF
jgi:hypothetical protein